MSEFVPVSECPLCGCHGGRPHSMPSSNLYSEMLAGLLGVAESELLDRLTNVQCPNCGLIRKERWLPRALISRLFTECVPAHPKGWDVLSGRFTPENFQGEVVAYRRALDAGDAKQINRYRRALTSILDSIPALSGTAEGMRLLRAIDTGDTDTLRAADSILRGTMHEPTAFKRFSGFSALSLWEYMESRLGRIRSYAEVGCPLWGLLHRARERGCRAVHLGRDEPNYWSTGCRQDGVHCVAHLVATTAACTADWRERPETLYDSIGVFQYLDHLEQPGDFMTELFHRTRSAAVILDAADDSIHAQHYTGWTTQSVNWLADRHGCRVHDDFADVRPSGNRLFLLVRN